MSEIYQAANVEEAVEMANQFKAENKYNWFRGQTVDYPPFSSLYRRRDNGKEKEFEQANFKYRLFLSWLEKIPELSYLLEPANEHQLEAIMQHYGIPTDYIDFTTDPAIAGFFAADTQTPPVDRNSCIYCLDIDDLINVGNIMTSFDFRKGCIIQKVIIDVNNLWRLQAQRGVFLLCNYNFDIDYPIDKIVFPYTGYPSYPTRHSIYPIDKSALELLLDQYLDRERTALVHEELKEIVHMTRWEAFPDGFYAEAFIQPPEIKVHNSWTENPDQWRLHLIEQYDQTVGLYQRLRLNRSQDAQVIRKTLTYGIRQLLKMNPAIRSRAINWDFEELPDNVSKDEFSKLVSIVWNGMRSLPYDHDDIAEACGNTAYLYMKSIGIDYLDNATELKIFEELFGPGMRVGFANEDNTGSYGYAAFEMIKHATVINVSQLVTEDFQSIAANTRDTFKIIYNPKLLFDFIKFKALFARQVIPTQVAWKQSLVIFNAARLITFGIP